MLWRQEHFVEGNLTDRKLHCTAWSSYEKGLMDAKYKTGRAFAFFTIITLILAVSPVLALSCATIDAATLRLLAACFLLATFFQALVFISLASYICQDEFHCKISFEGGLTVAGMLFCLMTAFYLVRVKQASHMSMEEKAAPVTGGLGGTHEEENKLDDHQEDHDDSSTHAIDEEEHRESKDGYDTPMQEIEEGKDGEEDEAGQANAVADEEHTEVPVDPAVKEKKSWWFWRG
jgi:hypothetical protein